MSPQIAWNPLLWVLHLDLHPPTEDCTCSLVPRPPSGTPASRPRDECTPTNFLTVPELAGTVVGISQPLPDTALRTLSWIDCGVPSSLPGTSTTLLDGRCQQPSSKLCGVSHSSNPGETGPKTLPLEGGRRRHLMTTALDWMPLQFSHLATLRRTPSSNFPLTGETQKIMRRLPEIILERLRTQI